MQRHRALGHLSGPGWGRIHHGIKGALLVWLLIMPACTEDAPPPAPSVTFEGSKEVILTETGEAAVLWSSSLPGAFDVFLQAETKAFLLDTGRVVGGDQHETLISGRNLRPGVGWLMVMVRTDEGAVGMGRIPLQVISSWPSLPRPDKGLGPSASSSLGDRPPAVRRATVEILAIEPRAIRPGESSYITWTADKPGLATVKVLNWAMLNSVTLLPESEVLAGEIFVTEVSYGDELVEEFTVRPEESWVRVELAYGEERVSDTVSIAFLPPGVTDVCGAGEPGGLEVSAGELAVGELLFFAVRPDAEGWAVRGESWFLERRTAGGWVPVYPSPQVPPPCRLACLEEEAPGFVCPDDVGPPKALASLCVADEDCPGGRCDPETHTCWECDSPEGCPQGCCNMEAHRCEDLTAVEECAVFSWDQSCYVPYYEPCGDEILRMEEGGRCAPGRYRVTVMLFAHQACSSPLTLSREVDLCPDPLPSCPPDLAPEEQICCLTSRAGG